jgi:hypothetical protein
VMWFDDLNCREVGVVAVGVEGVEGKREQEKKVTGIFFFFFY